MAAAVEVVARYVDNVKDGFDMSQEQAEKNAANAMMRGKVDLATFHRAISNYAKTCEILRAGSTFRFDAKNFFGRNAEYKPYAANPFKLPDPPDGRGAGGLSSQQIIESTDPIPKEIF